MSKNEVRFKGVMDKEELISCLDEIIAAMKQGVLTLEGQGQAVSVRPGSAIEMEIKVKSKEDKEKLELELGWRLDKELKVKPVDMKISSRELTEKDSGQAVSENPEPEKESKAPARSGPTIAAHEHKG